MSNQNTKERRQLAADARRQLSEQRKRVGILEREIAVLETKQTHLTAELEKPETYHRGGTMMQLNRELMSVQDDLAAKTAEWEAAALKITALEVTANSDPG